MTTLTNANKDILSRAVKEFDASLTRAAAERDLQKGIVDRVKETTGIEPKITRMLSKLYFAQNKEEKESEFDEIMGLYESVLAPSSE